MCKESKKKNSRATSGLPLSNNWVGREDGFPPGCLPVPPEHAENFTRQLGQFMGCPVDKFPI